MAKRRRLGPKRSTSIAFDLNKMSHEIRNIINLEGEGIIGELAERVAEEARSLAPVLQGEPRGSNKRNGDDRSGPLKENIFAQPSAKVPGSWIVCSPAWYSHFVEYGTSEHDMPYPGTKVLKEAGQPYPKVHHTGAKQKPFLRPAADKAEQFLQEIIAKRH